MLTGKDLNQAVEAEQNAEVAIATRVAETARLEQMNGGKQVGSLDPGEVGGFDYTRGGAESAALFGQTGKNGLSPKQMPSKHNTQSDTPVVKSFTKKPTEVNQGEEQTKIAGDPLNKNKQPKFTQLNVAPVVNKSDDPGKR